MSKSESWWIVRVNYGGVTKPIKCYRPAEYDEHILWDKGGDFDCDMKAGIRPIGGSQCVQFQTPYKKEADLFYSGAQSVAKLLIDMFKAP